MICEIKRYKDEEDKNLTVEVDISTQKVVKISGTVLIDTNMGRIPASFPFDSSKTIEECFATYDKTFEEYVQKIRNEKKNDLVLPPKDLLIP